MCLSVHVIQLFSPCVSVFLHVFLSLVSVLSSFGMLVCLPLLCLCMSLGMLFEKCVYM